MTVTPVSHEALLLDNLRRTVADCETFRDCVGASNRAEAEALIFGIYALDDDEAGGVARAVVYLDDNAVARLAGNDLWNEEEQLVLLIELSPPEELTDLWDQQVWFFNQVGAIRKEMKSLGNPGADPGAGPYLSVTELNRRMVGLQDPKRNNGRSIWGIEYSVQWRGGIG